MNEQIKLLAEQAGFSTWVLNPSKETMSDTPELLEKFAELIVKDCCQFNYDFLESYREASEVNSKIRTHFGVEE